MMRRQLTQLRGHVLVAAHGQRRIDTQFSGQEPLLRQPRKNLPVQDFRRHIRQWLTAPQPQCIRQQRRCPVRSALGSRGPGPAHQSFETVQIEDIAGQINAISLSTGHDRTGSCRGIQRLAQPHHITAQRALRAIRYSVTP